MQLREHRLRVAAGLGLEQAVDLVALGRLRRQPARQQSADGEKRQNGDAMSGRRRRKGRWILASGLRAADDRRRMVRATVAAIGLALALAPAAFATHNEPLRGQWSFEDPQCVDAPCYVADSSGHALTGLDYGSTQTVPGRWGTAVQQPNKSSYIDVGNQPLLQPATVTVVAWVRASSTPGLIQYAVSQGANGGCSYSSYAIYTGAVMPGLRFYVATGSGLFFSPAASNTMWDGAWHMTAGTYDGVPVRFYVDGHEVGSGTPASGPSTTALAANNNFVIGNFADPPECAENTNFTGDVDEVRVYSRALTATEIGRLADPAATSPPASCPTADRVRRPRHRPAATRRSPRTPSWASRTSSWARSP